ncbi:MAG: hypothetical protein LKE17_01720 [Lactobacillus sp.]|jgi:ribosomal protein L25 (general stress protein Ctc)|nr:hypothetical protein [Lactobacillus sp.]
MQKDAKQHGKTASNGVQLSLAAKNGVNQKAVPAKKDQTSTSKIDEIVKNVKEHADSFNKGTREDPIVVRTVTLNKPGSEPGTTKSQQITQSIYISADANYKEIKGLHGKKYILLNPQITAYVNNGEQSGNVPEQLYPSGDHSIYLDEKTDDFDNDQSKQNYYEFMALTTNSENWKVTLPAFDKDSFKVKNYAYKITSRVPESAGIDSEVINPYDIKPETVTIDYQKGVQTANVIYQFVDDDDNEKQVGNNVKVSGESGTEQTVSLTVPTNYELAENRELPKKVKIGDIDTTVQIHLKHQMDTIDTRTETVTRKITVNNPITHQAEVHDQTVTFTKTTMQDKITGKKSTSYDHDELVLPAYDAPEIPKYVPIKRAEKLTVKPGDKPAAVTIDYVENKISVEVSGTPEILYGDKDWVDYRTKVPADSFRITLTSSVNSDDKQIYTPQEGDLEYENKSGLGGVDSYNVVLTQDGFTHIKELYVDQYIFPEFSDVINNAKVKVDKNNVDFALHGNTEKIFNSAGDLPQSFDTSFGFGAGNANQITLYKPDGTPVIITLQPSDLAFLINRHKVGVHETNNVVNVGSYDVVFSDSAKERMKKLVNDENEQNYDWGEWDSVSAHYTINPASGTVTLSGKNYKEYDGHLTTTDDVNNGGDISIKLKVQLTTTPAYPGDEVKVLSTFEKDYVLQDGDYSWTTEDGRPITTADGTPTAPVALGKYKISLNQISIITRLQNDLDKKFGKGKFEQYDQSNVEITNADGEATFEIVSKDKYRETRVIYVDSSDQEIKNPDGSAIPGSHYLLKGKDGDKINTDIDSKVPAGWHITDKKYPKEITFDENTDPEIKVHVAKDGQQPVDPGDKGGGTQEPGGDQGPDHPADNPATGDPDQTPDKTPTDTEKRTDNETEEPAKTDIDVAKPTHLTVARKQAKTVISPRLAGKKQQAALPQTGEKTTSVAEILGLLALGVGTLTLDILSRRRKNH